MKTFLSITCVLFFAFNSVSNSQVYYGFDESYELSPDWDYYANNYLSGPSAGKGNTGIAATSNGISSVSINPASFVIGNKFETCFQTDYKFPLTVPNALFYPPEKYLNALPSISIAAGFKPSNNFQVGLFYSNPSSLRYISGEAGELTTVMTIQTIGVPLCLSLKKVNLGLTMEYSFYNSTISGFLASEGQNEAYVKAEKINFRFGCIYKANDNFSIGAALTPPVSLDVKSTLPHIGLELPPPPYYPLKIGAGVEYRFTEIPLKLSFDYNFTEATHGDYAYSKDLNNVNFGAEFKLNGIIILRAGFFTLNSSDFYTAYDQNFITLGCGIKLRDFNVDAAILHSHILNGTASNNIIQTSVAYGF